MTKVNQSLLVHGKLSIYKIIIKKQMFENFSGNLESI